MIFLGASQSKIGIDPMKMFIDTGITGYSLATDAQPLYVSSLLLQEAFEKQIPKLVVLDIGTCFHKDEFFQDKSYRFVSDNMKNDKSKEQLSLYFASRFPYRKRIENYLSMKFPLIQYHDRWKTLTQQDFQLFDHRNYYRKGHHIASNIAPTWIEKNTINNLSQKLRTPGKRITIDDKEEIEIENVDSSPKPVISSMAEESILDIKKLCDENDVELLLIKFPAVYGPIQPIFNNSVWTKEKSDIVKNFCNQHAINYIDLFYDIDVEIDWSTETYDGGLHLNQKGAQKITKYLQEYIKQNYGFESSESIYYIEDIPIYHEIIKIADLQMTQDIKSYLEKITNMNNAAVIISLSGNIQDYFGDDIFEQLLLGADKKQFDDEIMRQIKLEAGAIIIERGQVVAQAYSDKEVREKKIVAGKNVVIDSTDFSQGAISEILIDGYSYAYNALGLNIIVLDLESGLILDWATFSANSTDKNIHNNAETNLRNYELYLMKKDYQAGIGR